MIQLHKILLSYFSFHEEIFTYSFLYAFSVKLLCCFSYWTVRVMIIQTLVFNKVQILLFINKMSLNKLK